MSKTFSLPPFPQDWGKDEISSLVTDIFTNNVAATLMLSAEVKYLKRIYAVMSSVVTYQESKEDIPYLMFMSRCKIGYAMAYMLAVGGAPAESFMIMRGCIESALYGYHVYRNDGRFKLWNSYNNNDQARKQVIAEFQVSKIINNIRAIDGDNADRLDKLYKDTIAMGAHPNSIAVLSQFEIPEDTKVLTHNYIKAHHEDPIYHIAPKFLAKTGAAIMSIGAIANPNSINDDKVRKEVEWVCHSTYPMNLTAVDKLVKHNAMQSRTNKKKKPTP